MNHDKFEAALFGLCCGMTLFTTLVFVATVWISFDEFRR